MMSRKKRFMGPGVAILGLLCASLLISSSLFPQSLASTRDWLFFSLAEAAQAETPIAEPTDPPQMNEDADAILIAETQSRLKRIEEMLKTIKPKLDMAEGRTYYNKMLGRAQMRWQIAAVAVLAVIAIGHPLVLFYLSRRRVLGKSEVSTQIAETLVMVEERQAKLANILRELQTEVDYLHGMSVPELKSLMEEAQRYLKQNESDLGEVQNFRADAEEKGTESDVKPS